MMLQNILSSGYKSKTAGYAFVDLVIIAFIYFLPSLSHLTSIPFYLFEPMRLAIIFCILSTSRNNSLLIALTLPVISLIISSHPVLVKSLLITLELIANVLLLYYLIQRLRNKFLAILLSIFFAKVVYYMGKLSLLSLGLLDGELISTPLWLQYIMMFLFSIYGALAFKRKQDYQS
jgi:hypothetical protein